MNNLRDEREMTVTKKYITWSDVEKFVSYVASKTNDFKDFNGVYGPARGGVTLAAIISNRYNLPYLGAPQVGCIIVDDIVDNGDTALTWKNKGYTIATLCYHKNNNVEPDYWTEEKIDEWVVFPWEEDTSNK